MKPKKVFLSFLIFICLNTSTVCLAQYADFLWARTGAGPATPDYGRSVCADSQGNVIFAGTFNDTIIFGTDTLFGLPSFWDIFLVKYDPLGNVLWAKSAGGSGHDWGQSVCVDSMDNIYITGSFASQNAFFGTDTLINSWSGTPPGPYADIFLAKYSPVGSLLWARSAGGQGIEEAHAVCYDSETGVCITGRFTDDTFIFNGDTLINYGDVDAFVAKYDTSGNFTWAKSAGSFSEDWGLGIDCDALGNIYTTGWMDGITANYGDTAYNCTVDYFIAKYDSAGNFVWALSPDGTADSHAESITVDKDGNILVAGLFYSGNMTFGTYTLLNTSANWDAFVVKYDSNGNPIWASSLGGPNMDYAESVTTDPIGNVYVTGPFESMGFMFGSTSFSNTGIANSDCFLVKYSPAGNPVWGAKAGGAGVDIAYCVTTDNLGNVFCSGLFMGPSCNFGSVSLFGLSSAYNVFVAKIDHATSLFEHSSSEESWIHFYPNPFSNNAILEIKDFKIDNSVLYLFDITGREVLKKEIKNQFTEIQKGNLNPGMYFYKVVSEDNLIGSGKIIIQ